MDKPELFCELSPWMVEVGQKDKRSRALLYLGTNTWILSFQDDSPSSEPVVHISCQTMFTMVKHITEKLPQSLHKAAIDSLVGELYKRTQIAAEYRNSDNPYDDSLLGTWIDRVYGTNMMVSDNNAVYNKLRKKEEEGCST